MLWKIPPARVFKYCLYEETERDCYIEAREAGGCTEWKGIMRSWPEHFTGRVGLAAHAGWPWPVRARESP